MEPAVTLTRTVRETSINDFFGEGDWGSGLTVVTALISGLPTLRAVILNCGSFSMYWEVTVTFLVALSSLPKCPISSMRGITRQEERIVPDIRSICEAFVGSLVLTRTVMVWFPDFPLGFNLAVTVAVAPGAIWVAEATAEVQPQEGFTLLISRVSSPVLRRTKVCEMDLASAEWTDPNSYTGSATCKRALHSGLGGGVSLSAF